MKNIYSIIVAYKPEGNELTFAVERLIVQTDMVIVCNNSDYDVKFDDEKVKVFNFKDNLGIAAAQSIGMKWAFENGADFILQMDQDSIPDEQLVDTLFKSYEELTRRGYRIGLIGSQDFDKDSKKVSKPKIDKGKFIEKETYIKINQVISSGSLIPKNTYELVGGMEDGLFIDAVDYEYCWRISDRGLLVVKNIDALIAHKFGYGTIKVFGMFDVIMASPMRHYYQYRNLFLLFNRSYVPFYWKLSNSLKQFFKLFLIPFILDRRKQRYSFIIKGIKDGILGRVGRIDNAK